jgi:hypothetical protein
LPPELIPVKIRGGAERSLTSGARIQLISGHTNLWTGEIAVTIYASPDMAETIISELRPLNGAAKSRPLLDAPPSAQCAEIQGRPRKDVPLPIV